MSRPVVIKVKSRNVRASPSIQLDLKKVEKMRQVKPVEPIHETKEVELEDVSLNVQNTEDTEVVPDDRILSRDKVMLEGIRPIVKDVLHQLKDRMREHQLKLTPKTMVSIVKFAMEIVEKTALKGIQKRELVNEMLLHIIEASPISEDQRELCRMLIENEFIGNTVDLIVNATKGTLKINRIQEFAESTKSCCFAFLSRR